MLNAIGQFFSALEAFVWVDFKFQNSTTNQLRVYLFLITGTREFGDLKFADLIVAEVEKYCSRGPPLAGLCCWAMQHSFMQCWES